MTDAPVRRTQKNPPSCSNMCESGRKERRRIFGPMGKTCAAEIAFERTLRCVSIAPFGSPVVPEVKTTSARSSRVVGALSSGARAKARPDRERVLRAELLGGLLQDVVERLHVPP